MAYKVLSSLTANNVNSADLLKVKTDLLIIAVNKKTAAAAELKSLQASAQSLVKESIKEINSGSRKSIFLPAPAKVSAKNILLIKEPDPKAASFLVLRYYEEIMGLVKSSKAKDFAYLMSSTTSKDFDEVWAAEVAARTFESAAYTFNATKNKTAKPITVKKGALLFAGLTPAKLRSVKAGVRLGHAVGEGMKVVDFVNQVGNKAQLAVDEANADNANDENSDFATAIEASRSAKGQKHSDQAFLKCKNAQDKQGSKVQKLARTSKVYLMLQTRRPIMTQ